MDGSFMSGIKPYIDIDSVMNHPLWGSNLLLSNEDVIIKGIKDYIRGYNIFTNNYSEFT